MSELLKSCISQLREMHSSGEMAPADRDQLRSVITSLEELEDELEGDHDDSWRSQRVFQYVELAARILVKIFIDRT